METVAVSSVEKLSGYGPLGLACAFLVLAVIYLVRRNEKQEDRHRLEIKAKDEKLEELYVRLVTEAKTWADTGQAIAGKQVAALESMIRTRRGGG